MTFFNRTFGRSCSGFFTRCSVLLLPALSVLSPAALAHDHFMWADEYQLAAGDAVTLTFNVGHAGEFAAWPHGLTQVAAIGANGPIGRTDGFNGLTRDSARITLTTPGTHVVAMSSYRSESELQAEAFDAYVDKEGLTAVAKHRMRADQQGKAGTEWYSRRAKALVQVGDQTTANAMERLGLELEIVPLRNPYDLAKDELLPVQVWYRGKVLAGARIELEHLTLQAFAAQSKMTDEQGTAQFAVTPTGEWKLNVVWSEPLVHRGASYSTVFSSLTFGY